MRMPENWLEWLGVVGSILTIISFGLYLLELHKRKKQDYLMLGFLHGVKSHVESASKRTATTGDDWLPLLQQINDMLGRLQPSSSLSRMPVMVTVLCILWGITTCFYFVAHVTNGNESFLFGWLTAGFFIAASIMSLLTFGFWMDEHDEKKQVSHPRQER